MDTPVDHGADRNPVDAPPRRTLRAGRSWAYAVVVATVLLLTACSAGVTAARVPPPQAAPAAPGPMTRADVDAWLDGRLPDALARTGIAGAAVSVVHDGTILTTRGYGRSDTGDEGSSSEPVDPAQTVFRIGSVSKLFTDTAVLQLLDQGRIDLDTDISRYLDFPVPHPRGVITVRNLLTHTAGFEERAQDLIEPPGTALDLRRYLATDPPAQIYRPGTVPAYSNYGNALAGYIVQRVSGVPFADYVQHHIFAPVGMTSSTFAQPLPAALAPRMARGYADDTVPAAPFELVAAAPAGAMSTTATDMGAFMLAQLGEGRQLLGPDTLALMHRPALGADTLGVFAQGPRMTLGFFDDSRNGHAILGHDGDTEVFHAALEIYPQDRTGIFIALNSTGHTATDAYELRQALMHEFTDRYFPGSAAPAPTVATAPADATAVAGTYESSRSFRTTFVSLLRLTNQTRVVARPDGTLLVLPDPETFAPAAYEEIAPSLWREVGGERTLTVRTAHGRVDAIGYGSAFTLLRVDAAHNAVVVLPVVVGSLLVLLLAALSWPVRTLVRRHYATGADRRPHPGALVVLRRIGIGSTLAATLGWAVILSGIDSFRTLPDAVVRVVQLLQVVGLLGVVPAVLAVVTSVRRRARGGELVLDVLLLLALTVVACLAVVYRLVAPSISF